MFRFISQAILVIKVYEEGIKKRTLTHIFEMQSVRRRKLINALKIKALDVNSYLHQLKI